jgi:2-C-methyl-D-erythritol 2,4-cyclodiphosphate synthase
LFPFRIGFGFDVHQLTAERELWLGGVLVPAQKGALGHSDADVLLHAICDALLGAAALGDIGKHFPDTSQQYKGIDSKILLQKVAELIENEGYHISNIDATLVLEKPKIAPYIETMKNTIASILNINSNQVSIKATTNETMGFVGRQEGVTAHAVTLIFSKNQ